MIYLARMAARNVLRNRRRSLLTIMAVGAGLSLVIFFKGLANGEKKQVIDAFISLWTSHIQIHGQGYSRDWRHAPLEHHLKKPYELIARLSQMEGVRSAAPRIRFGCLLSSGTESVHVVAYGVDPKLEPTITKVHESLIKGSYIRKPGLALVGKPLARDFRLHVGSPLILVTATLPGGMNAIEVEVAGIYSTGYTQSDSTVIYLDLRDAQKLLDMPDMATEVVLMCRGVDQVRGVASTIKKEMGSNHAPGGVHLEIQTWEDLVSGILNLFEIRDRFIHISFITVLLVAALGIVNTMLMTVMERVREIGTMAALGFTRRELVLLFLMEALVLGLIGGILGALGGGALTYYFATYGISFEGTAIGEILPIADVIYAEFSFPIIVKFFFVALGVSILSALYPAYLTSRMEPASALRHT